MRRVVLTGGAGFIGSHLADALLRDGCEVVILDDLSTGKLENIPRGSRDDRHRLSFVFGSVLDNARLREALFRAREVVHLAAKTSVPRSIKEPLQTFETNVAGTASVIRAAGEAGASRVVVFSSSSVYGDAPERVKTESLPHRPLSPYATSKAMAESLAVEMGRCSGLDVAILRPFNVFGPRQDPRSGYAAVIPRFCRALAEGQRPTIFGDGEQVRDFCPVGSVVDAVRTLLYRPEALRGEAFNVAGGAPLSVRSLFGRLAAVAGRTDCEPIFAPRRDGDVLDSRADLDRLGRLGWSPDEDLDGRLRETYEWVRDVVTLKETPR